jgi:hypothetical protein
MIKKNELIIPKINNELFNYLPDYEKTFILTKYACDKKIV